MIVYIVLILIIGVVSFIMTYKELGRSDPNYLEKRKSHFKFLSLLYVVAIIGSIIALITYMSAT